MDGLFLIPIFTSKKISYSLSSVVCKLAEVVNIQNYKGLLYEASSIVAERYIGESINKNVINEKIFLDNASSNNGVRIVKTFSKGDSYSLEEFYKFVERSIQILNESGDRGEMGLVDLGFEPTIVNVHVNLNSKVPYKDVFVFGFKAVPVFMDNVDYLIKKLSEIIEYNRFGLISRLFYIIKNLSEIRINSKLNKILDVVLNSYSFYGSLSPSKISRIIIRNNVKGFRHNEPEVITYGLCLLRYELDDIMEDYEKLIEKYREMSRKGLGDLIIIDDTKESIHYCNHVFKRCDVRNISDIAKLFNKEEITISSSSVSSSSFI